MSSILKKAADGAMHEIEWKDGERLANLDFVDYNVLMKSSWEGMIELTSKVGEEAAKVDLCITAD